MRPLRVRFSCLSNGTVDLVRSAGGEVVGIGVVLTEAKDWQETLGEDAGLIHSLAHIPQFTQVDGTGVPIPETFL